MKYIKLYEQLSQTYFEIGLEEEEEKKNVDNRDSFSFDEIQYIEKTFENFSITKSNAGVVGSSFEIDDSDGVTIYLYKCKDQWFYIYVLIHSSYYQLNDKNYKCDQWDGFVDCIKSEILPILNK